MADMDKDSKAARKNASNACKGCRESKIKCDGQQPCSGCTRKERECVYDSRDDKRRVQLRTAVHILVRRVQQLSKIIVEAEKEIPPLSTEDEEFLDRIVGTLGLSDAPPYEPGSVTKAAKSGKRSAESRDQTQITTITSPTPQPTGPLAPLQQNVQSLGIQHPTSQGNINDFDFSTAEFNNVAGILAGMNPQSAILSPGSNMASSEDHISPDWPFSTLDNMLNFDHLFDANGLSMQFLNDTSADIPPPVLQQITAPVQVSQPEREPQQDDSSGDEENAELVNQLSARLGSLRLAPDGKLRYFGTMSNLHLIDSQKVSSENFALHTPSRVNKARLLEVADLSQAVDVHLEDHLLRLFFTWHNPSSYIVDEEVFYMARQSWANSGVQNSYYNDVLKDAMCAIGASFGSQCHSTLITYPRSMPQFFSDRAKILLDSHLDSPCVATAQALVLLASFEETCQNIARGWLFGGMAMRIAFDLGLHVNSKDYVAQGVLTPAEARARQVAFWGIYISNLLWSFHLGRPFSLDSSEITVPKPLPSPPTPNPTWSPYPPNVSSISGLQPHVFTQQDLTHEIFTHWIFLCQNIAAVAHALYSHTSMDISKSALQELNEETTTELFHWHANLTPSLQIDLSDPQTVKLPQLLLLHMEYHHLQIFLHRPWTSMQLQPEPRQGPGVHHARHICVSSAVSIARLLRIYELQYSFRFINVEIIRILSSAALILIFATVPSAKRNIDKETAAHLDICFRALEELGARFDSAKETRWTLLAVQRRWNDLYGGKRRGEKRGRGTEGFRRGGSKRIREGLELSRDESDDAGPASAPA